ncbi:MAG: tetratricopeptide repeat protein [Actinobacteria bacterium]|nr:tetratricopeptide repeat protein [Actinomycetota bacterium]
MARFEKQSPKGQKPNAGVKPAARVAKASSDTAPSPKPAPAKRPQKPQSYEDTMFFSRLRRHARWMFVFLAIILGGGLVIAGVGAGGVGVLDVFRDSGGGEAASVSSARKKTEKDPKDVEAWRDLAVAYQTDGRFTEATSALQTASALRPKNPDILRELATAQQAEATDKQREAQLAAYQGGFAAPTDPAGGFTVKGVNVLKPDRIQAAVAARFNERANEAYAAASAALSGSIATYRKIVALTPEDPNVQLELAQAAEGAGDSATAIAAYEQFLKLAPDDSSAPLVKDRLKTLKPKPAPKDE